jgi:type VI secretion system protein ImpC
MVGDYEFGRHPEDIELLEKIAGVAASAHAPFITSAFAKLFDMKDFFSLAQPRDLGKIFESTELIKWRSFRESDDSRYVTLTLPKVLLRLPYGPETVKVDEFDFTEDVDGTDASRYLWGNAAFVLAQRITNAYAKYGWLAAIRGVEGGGLVEGLPAHTFKTTSGDIKLTCPTQVTITDRREKELNDLGFMAILHRKGSDKAAFFGGQTANLPKKYFSDTANANARISSMLPYVLNASRFAHYIKVIMRDKLGSFLTKDNASDFLNNWIANYVLVDDSAPQEMKASYPLRDARINVTDVPGSPGKYRATVFLRPHFQLEELSTSIRLVAELP